MTPTTAAPFVTDLVLRRRATSHTDLALPFAIWARLFDTILREPVTLTFATWTRDEANVCFWFAHRRSYLRSSMRGATTLFTAYRAEAKLFVAFPQPFIVGIFFHHVVVVVVHHMAIPSAD